MSFCNLYSSRVIVIDGFNIFNIFIPFLLDGFSVICMNVLCNVLHALHPPFQISMHIVP